MQADFTSNSPPKLSIAFNRIKSKQQENYKLFIKLFVKCVKGKKTRIAKNKVA